MKRAKVTKIGKKKKSKGVSAPAEKLGQSHKHQFEQLLDDAILGVKKK
jgi:hypothetical protein